MNNEMCYRHCYNNFQVPKHQEPCLFFQAKCQKSHQNKSCLSASSHPGDIHLPTNSIRTELPIHLSEWRTKSHQTFKENSKMKGRDKNKQKKKVGKGYIM